MSSRGANSVIAAARSGATVQPSWAANRAARSVRSGSSLSDSPGRPGVRSTLSRRSAKPPKRSTTSKEGSRAAIALIVKSRRARSPSRVRPKLTAGLRDPGSYSSLR